jgi:cytoskeletal protein RodZ
MPITIGQHLRQAREERYISLEKASDETRIRAVFLRALEADDYSIIPSAAQGRGFLRNYAEYLGIDIDEVIAELHRNAPPPGQVSGPLPQVNLVESEVPPLTEPGQEQKPPPFWASWLARFRRTRSATEADAPAFEEQASPSAEADPPVPVPSRAELDRTQGDPHEETITSPAIEAGTPTEEVSRAEMRPSFPARLRTLFRLRMSGTGGKPPIEAIVEPPLEASSTPPPPAVPASQIIAEIGRELRERRELISLTIEEVERHTRMRAALVRALEEGSFDDLPSPVQTRGMLANYAGFLDLDADTILLRFADALQARHREKYVSAPRAQIETEVVHSIPLLRSFIAGDLVFGLAMIILIFALGAWGIGRLLNSEQEDSVEATAPSIVEVLAATPRPSPSAEASFVPLEGAPGTGEPAGSNPPAAPTLGENINVVVNLFAIERTFVRVSVDGELAFEGRIAPRETQVYEAGNQVEVLTGNGAALRITYNGRDLGLMGNLGEVVSRVYTIAGIVTPTATPAPTATETPLATVTPSPTQTATPTPEETTAPAGN